MKNAGITIQVKVDPIVREFIYAKLNGAAVVRLPQGDILYKMIHDWLQKPNRKHRRKIKPDNLITIYVPTTPTKNIYKSHHLTEFRQKLINDYIYQSLKTEFYKHVLDKISEGYRQRKAIYSFMELYHITDANINYEMLKKSWDRSVEKQKYMKNVKKSIHILTLLTPLTYDITGIFEYINTINCPQLINT